MSSSSSSNDNKNLINTVQQEPIGPKMKRGKHYYHKTEGKWKRVSRRKKKKSKKKKRKKRYISSLYRPTGNEDFSIRERFFLSREQELELLSKPGYPVWMIETPKDQYTQRVSAGFTLSSAYETVIIQILFSNDDLLKGNTVKALKTTVFPMIHPIYELPNTLNYTGVLDDQTIFEDDSDTIRKTEEFALQVNNNITNLPYKDYKSQVTEITDLWLKGYVADRRGSSLKELFLSFTGYNFLEWMMWIPVPRLSKTTSKLSFHDWVEVFLTRQELQRRDLTYTFLLYHNELLTDQFINEMSFPSQSILFPDDRYAPIPNDILLEKISVVNDNNQEDPTGLKWPGMIKLTSLPLNSADKLYKKILETGFSIKKVIEESGYSDLMLKNIEYSIKQVASTQAETRSDGVSPALYQDVSTYFSGGGIKKEHLKHLIENASYINKDNYLTLFLINIFLDICLELLKLSRRYTQFVLFYYPVKSTRVDIFSLEEDGKLQLDKLPLPKLPLERLKDANIKQLDEEIEYLLDYLGKLHRLNRSLDEKEPFVITQKYIDTIATATTTATDFQHRYSTDYESLISARFERRFGSSLESKFISSGDLYLDSDAKKIRYAILERLVYNKAKIGNNFVVSNDRRALYEKDMILAGKQLIVQLKQPLPLSFSPTFEHLLSLRTATMAMFSWLQEDDTLFGDDSDKSRIESFSSTPYISRTMDKMPHYGLKNRLLFNPVFYSTEHLLDAFQGKYKGRKSSFKGIINLLVNQISLKYLKSLGVFRYILVHTKSSTELGDSFVVYSKTDRNGAVIMNPWFHLKLSSLPPSIADKVYNVDEITFTYLSDLFIKLLSKKRSTNSVISAIAPYNRFSTGHLRRGNLSFSLIDMPKTFKEWLGQGARKIVIQNFLFPMYLDNLIQPKSRLEGLKKVKARMSKFSMTLILERVKSSGKADSISRKMIGLKDSEFYNTMIEVMDQSLEYILSRARSSDSVRFRFHREAKLYRAVSNKTSNQIFDENRIYLLLGYNKQFTRTNISSFSPTLAIMYAYLPKNGDKKVRAFIDFYLKGENTDRWTRKTRIVGQGKEDELIQSSLWYYSYPLRDLRLSPETIIERVLSKTWKPGSTTAKYREAANIHKVADYNVGSKFLFANTLMLLNDVPPKINLSEPLYDTLKENNIKSSVIVKDVLLKDRITTLKEVDRSSLTIYPASKNRMFFSSVLSEYMQTSERLMAIFDDIHNSRQNEVYTTILKIHAGDGSGTGYLVKINNSKVVFARTINLVISQIMKVLKLKESDTHQLELITLLVDTKAYKQTQKKFFYRQ